METKKKIYVLEEHKDKLIGVLEKIVSVVVSTMGPAGKNCILYDGEQLPRITKDGVTVAEFLQFDDSFEEAINKIIKETARKTGEKVGDGTTTSTLLACELISLILQKEENDIKNNLKIAKKEIDLVIKNIKSSLLELNVFDDETINILRAIVNLSSNGDKEVTNLIIDIVEKIGADGIIDVTEGLGEETFTEIQDGMLIESPAHVTHTIEVDKPYIVLVSSTIEKGHQIKSCMQLAASTYKEVPGSSFIIVAKEFSKEVRNYVTFNNRRNVHDVYLAESDGFASNMLEILDDMARLLNCKILSTDIQSDFGLQNIKIKHVAQIKSATISPQQTVLYNDIFLTEETSEIKKNLVSRVSELKKSGADKIGEITQLERRLTKFSKSAKIIVGGSTDAEKGERKDRVEDAVQALRSAINGGVVPGGGYTLYDASKELAKFSIVKSVCQKPAKILSDGIDYDISAIFDSRKVMDF